MDEQNKNVCSQCQFVAKTEGYLRTHMKKHQQSVEDKPKDEYATKSEFKSLEDKMQTLMGMVEKTFETLEKKTEAPKQKEVQQDKEKTPEMPVPPKWFALAEEILSQEIAKSLRVSYPLVRITIPEAMSNASKDHLEFYHHDIRTLSLKPGEGEAQIKSWLEKVQKNLVGSQNKKL